MFTQKIHPFRDRGFTLVEALIVISLIGVLAVLSFNYFSGALQNSKKKADYEMAERVEKALQTLILESSIPDLIGNFNQFKKEPHPQSEPAFERRGDHVGIVSIILALQSPIYVQNSLSPDFLKLGPYLYRSPDNLPSYQSFAPTWNPMTNGKHIGYEIVISSRNQSVRVSPAEVEDEHFDALNNQENFENYEHDGYSNSRIVVEFN